MNPPESHKLIIISGPSCVGKSPLLHAFMKSHPQRAESLRKLILYNSRAPRPHESDGVDYHFRPRKFLKKLRKKKGLLVMNVRGDLQALDTAQIAELLKTNDVVYEGNPFIATRLLKHKALKKTPILSVFIAPLSRDEIVAIKKRAGGMVLKAFITGIMKHKLKRRTVKQKGAISPADKKNIKTRARSAYPEMKLAHYFNYVLVNHDGEDNDNWQEYPSLVGDARKTLISFAELLRGRIPQTVEHWKKNLL